jgi:hypothetical protein
MRTFDVLASRAARSIGTAHHVTIRLSNPVAATADRPISPSLTASHRLRVTLWFPARRKVPVSSSREISGAPQKIPMSPGRKYTAAIPTMYTVSPPPATFSSAR